MASSCRWPAGRGEGCRSAGAWVLTAEHSYKLALVLFRIPGGKTIWKI